MKLTIIYTDGTEKEINSVTKVFPKNDMQLYYETTNHEPGRGTTVDFDKINFWEVTDEV